MKILFENCKVFDSSNRIFKPRSILVSDGIILDLLRHTDRRPEVDSVIDCGGRQVIPGLIDIHTHGRAGADFNAADADDMRNMAKSYSEYGVTSVFPTLASAEFESLCCQAELIDSLKGNTDGAEFLGVHLEGRYLNPSKGGAHNPDLLVLPNTSELEEFAGYSKLPLRVSAAYELEGGDVFAEKAKELGATLSLAHTAATYGEAKEIYRKHKVAFTHLYNCMPPIHHRDGGTVLAALESGGFCELICDGHHIHPASVRLAFSIFGGERMVLVSDSGRCAGKSEGYQFDLGGQMAEIRGGVAKLVGTETIACSASNLWTCLANTISWGVPEEEAVRAASYNPAKALGVQDKIGSIETGKYADFIITNADYSEKRVFIGGKEL